MNSIARLLRGRVPTELMVGLLADYLLGALGIFFVATVAALWLATQDPRPVREPRRVSEFWTRQRSRTATETAARLVLLAFAALHGWRLDDAASAWWTIPLALLGVAVMRHPIFAHWTDGAITLVGVATVVASTALIRPASLLHPGLITGHAVWTGLSLVLLTGGVFLLGIALTVRPRAASWGLIGAGAAFTTVGAGAAIGRTLEAAGSPPSASWWGGNDHLFVEILAVAGAGGILLIALGILSRRPSIATHCIIPLASLLAGVALAWNSGIEDQAVLVVTVCVLIGAAVSRGTPSRRLRAVVASALFAVSGLTTLVHWLWDIDQFSAIVLALAVSAATIVCILVWVGWRSTRMTDAEFAALP